MVQGTREIAAPKLGEHVPNASPSLRVTMTSHVLLIVSNTSLTFR